MDKRVVVKVVETELDADALQRSLTTDGCGAVVSFVGITRDLEAGERVLQLEFDAWKEQLNPTLQKLAESAKEAYGVSGIAMAHRVGIVDPQESIVAIHVCSAHRKEAFSACNWLIDELKLQAPLWKKEVTESGATWKAGLG